MQYNECSYCGAKDGRAGLLVGSELLGIKPACMNCYDTIVSKNVVIHSNLSRTDEELNKTMALARGQVLDAIFGI